MGREPCPAQCEAATGIPFSRGKSGDGFRGATVMRGRKPEPPPKQPSGPVMAGPDRLYRVLTGGKGLQFTCADCGHTGQMAAEVALAKFEPIAMPSQVRNRMRCSKCGSKRCEVRI